MQTKRRPRAATRPRGRSHSLGIEPVLLDRGSARQRLRRVVVAHRHAACRTIGPPSSSPVTRCTVAPLTFTPCASACACASTPGNAGSSDGWMFRIAFGKGLEQRRPDQAHEAGEADERHAARSAARAASARSKSSRDGELRGGRSTASRSGGARASRPAAPGRFEMTTAMRAVERCRRRSRRSAPGGCCRGRRSGRRAAAATCVSADVADALSPAAESARSHARLACCQPARAIELRASRARRTGDDQARSPC